MYKNESGGEFQSWYQHVDGLFSMLTNMGQWYVGSLELSWIAKRVWENLVSGVSCA